MVAPTSGLTFSVEPFPIPPTQRLNYTFASLTRETDAPHAVQVFSSAECDKASPTMDETRELPSVTRRLTAGPMLLMGDTPDLASGATRIERFASEKFQTIAVLATQLLARHPKLNRSSGTTAC